MRLTVDDRCGKDSRGWCAAIFTGGLISGGPAFMHARRRVTLTALSTLGATVGLTPMEAHAAASGTTVYVDNSNPAKCSDAGPAAGSQATPYCTITAAGDAAQPGW